MSAARDEILGRIRTALGDVPATEAPTDAPVARDYRQGDERDRDALVGVFIDRLRDYTAQAERVAAAEAGRAVREACARMGLARVAVAPGIPDDWRPDGAVTVLEDDGLTAAELDALDGVVTGCAVGIAETGTIVLDGRPPSGRRVLTLVPDHHICLLTAEQIVGQVPEAIAALAPAVTGEQVPVTFVSGASATSDIELERVEGVHGPRHLLVLVLV